MKERAKRKAEASGSKMTKMNLILGTITFGQQTFDEDAAVMIDTALKNGIKELDTAYVYNEGECERVLGRVLAPLERGSYRLAIKANPRITGRLDRAAIFTQVNESLERLGTDRAELLYLHFPDRHVPLREQLQACNDLYNEGKIEALGLSNYSEQLIDEAVSIARDNGWLVPTVYEGVYNALSRRVEENLFECLRRNDMRFTAYNPLAGGILTGKYTDVDEAPKDGRFVKRASYKARYWHKEFFDAAALIRKACDDAGITMVEAALRWLASHSMLDAKEGDAIIIGASRPDQLLQNIDCVNAGPLPASVSEAIDKAWPVCKSVAPEYFKYIT